MTRTVTILILAISLFSFSGCKKENVDLKYNKKYVEEIKEFRKEVMSYMALSNIPGGSFAVFKNGELIYSEGIGYASKEFEIAATRNTKFRIGAVSECFTGVLFQILVSEGKIHPDSTVQFYVKDFPEKKYRMPVGTLPYHLSGIRQPTAEEVNWRGFGATLNDGINQFKNDSLLVAPGKIQIQSIFNYNLLGVVMEQATGQSFSQLLRTYITDSLHLNNTVTDNPIAIIKNRSEFFDFNFIAQVVNAAALDLRYKAPAEGLLSNAEDLATFGNAVLQSKIISDSMKEELLNPIIQADSSKTILNNGWISMTNEDGSSFYGRAAGITGGGAALLIYPDEQLVVAATVNLTDKSGQLPIIKLADKFRKKPEQGAENKQAE